MTHMSGTRTYVPTAVRILKGLCRYLVDHRERLEEVLGEGSAAAITALMTACEVFLALAAAVEGTPV